MSLSCGLLWSMFHSKLTLTLALFAVWRNGTTETHSAIRWPFCPSTAFEHIILYSLYKYIGQHPDNFCIVVFVICPKCVQKLVFRWIGLTKGFIACYCTDQFFLKQYTPEKFDIHWVVYRNIISIVKRNICTSVSNLFHFGITIYMFRTVFPSIIRSSRQCIQQQAFVKQILLSAF